MDTPTGQQPSDTEGASPPATGLGEPSPPEAQGLDVQPDATELGAGAEGIPQTDDPQVLRDYIASQRQSSDARVSEAQAKMHEATTDLARLRQQQASGGQFGASGSDPSEQFYDPYGADSGQYDSPTPEAQAIQQMQQQMQTLGAVVADVGIENRILKLQDGLGRKLTPEQHKQIRDHCNANRTADVEGAWRQIDYDRAIRDAEERGKQKALTDMQKAQAGSQKPPPGATAEPTPDFGPSGDDVGAAIQHARDRGDIPGIDEPLPTI